MSIESCWFEFDLKSSSTSNTPDNEFIITTVSLCRAEARFCDFESEFSTVDQDVRMLLKFEHVAD
jgi:hypothetical protein